MAATPEKIGIYDIIADLGTGGMGRVYLAEATQDCGDVEEGQRVAVKVVHGHLLEREGGFKRFLREADLGGRVRHNNVVRTFDVDALIQDGVAIHYLVMEYVQGQTLRSLLKELGRFPEELARRVAIEIARGLDGVHEIGIIHRDLKPENVLITEDEKVKIMDLGVSRLVDESIRLSNTGQFVGSLQYAAPEQFTSGSDLDAKTDLYGLGCVLYEIVSGRRPFRAPDPIGLMTQVVSEEPDPPSSYNPDVTEFLEEVIMNLLRKDKDERFESAAALLDVLENGERSRWWRERAGRPRTAGPRRHAPVPVERTHPLVGRNADAAVLGDALAKARAGQGQVVLLEGEAGIGKSRLLAELAHDLDGKLPSTPVLYGRHPPGDAMPAIAAFAQAMGHHVAPGAFDPMMNGTSTTTAMGAVVEALAGPEAGSDELGRALAESVCELGVKRHMVLIIEDLHEAPPEGRDLFSTVAAAVHGSPVLLIGSIRPDTSREWVKSVERMDHGRRHSLGRLDDAGVAALVRRRLPNVTSVRDVARVLAIKSDGNPLFVLEILRDLEGRVNLGDSGGLGAHVRVPESLQELIQARLDPLSDDERHLLDVAACFGVRFDPALVSEAADVEPITGLRRLARIESRRKLIRSVGNHFEFDHHQIRDVIHQALPPPLSRQYHAVIARRLESRASTAGSALQGADAVRIARQLFAAGETGAAIAYLSQARAHLSSTGQNEAEIELLDAALGSEQDLSRCQRSEMLLAKAANLGFVGRPAEQGLVLREAEAVAAQGDCDRAMARALNALGGFEIRAGRFDSAQHVLVRAEELAVACGDSAAEAGICGRLGRVLKNLGRYQEAIAYHKRQLRIVRDLADRRGEVVASANIGALYATIGRFKFGREKLERAVTLARELGWRWGEAMDSGRLGEVLESLGRFADAIPCYERQIRISREEGSPDGEARGLANLGRLDAYLGKFALARARLEDALGIARDLGRAQLEADALHGLGLLDTWLQNSDVAIGQFESALAARKRAGSAYGEIADTLALARVHWGVGRRDEAARLFAEANSLAAKIHALDAEAVSTAYLEHIAGGAPSLRLCKFARDPEGISAMARLDLVTILWRWTRDDEWAELAGRYLKQVVDRAPQDARETMSTCVPVFVRAASVRDNASSRPA